MVFQKSPSWRFFAQTATDHTPLNRSFRPAASAASANVMVKALRAAFPLPQSLPANHSPHTSCVSARGCGRFFVPAMRPALGFCGTASGSSSPASPSGVPLCSISDRRRACGRTRASSRPTSPDGGRTRSRACRRIPPSPSCPGCIPSSTSTWSGGSLRRSLSSPANGNGNRDRSESRGAGPREECRMWPRGCCWRAPRSGSCRSIKGGLTLRALICSPMERESSGAALTRYVMTLRDSRLFLRKAICVCTR